MKLSKMPAIPELPLIKTLNTTSSSSSSSASGIIRIKHEDAIIRIKEECDDYICTNIEEDSPLDLRINCGRSSSPSARDSGTESDDTDEKMLLHDDGQDCKPYKKSLIKRCKFSKKIK